MVCHNRHQCARCHVFMGEAVGQVGDAEACGRGGDEGDAVVGLEASLRTNRDDLVAVHELPGFGALQERLMIDQVVRRLGRTVRLDVVRARDKLGVDRANAPCDQIGVLQITHPNGAIVALGDEVNEAITVASLHMQLRMTACHFRQHRCEMSRAERQRNGHAQAAAKGAGRQDRFLGDVYLGTDSGGVVPECRAGLSECRPASGACQQLHTQFAFKPRQAATDDRLRYAKTQCSLRNAAGIGHFHEGLQFFDIHACVPLFATQHIAQCYYCLEHGNSTMDFPGAASFARVLESITRMGFGPFTNVRHP